MATGSVPLVADDGVGALQHLVDLSGVETLGDLGFVGLIPRKRLDVQARLRSTFVVYSSYNTYYTEATT